MSPMRSPRARRIARKLALLPILVAALLVVLVPAPAAGPPAHAGNGAAAVEHHKPYGAGDARKFK